MILRKAIFILIILLFLQKSIRNFTSSLFSCEHFVLSIATAFLQKICTFNQTARHSLVERADFLQKWEDHERLDVRLTLPDNVAMVVALPVVTDAVSGSSDGGTTW